MYDAEFFSMIKLVEANVLICPLYVSPLNWNVLDTFKYDLNNQNRNWLIYSIITMIVILSKNRVKDHYIAKKLYNTYF